MRTVLLALAMLFVAAAPASAWTSPANLSSPHEFIDSPALGFSTSGVGLATWLAGDGQTGEVDGAVLGGTQHVISKGPTPSVVSAPVHYATSRTLVTTLRETTLSAVFGDANGVFGAARLIATQKNLRDPVLAANADGEAAVAWFDDLGTLNDRVYVSVRPAGGSFGAPQLLATDRVRSVSVAVSPRGDLLVAWDARGTVKTRFKGASNHSFHSTDAISSQTTFYARLRTAVTGNGRAYVAWGSQLLTEGGDRGPVYYEAAVRPAGASKFRAAQLLEQQSNAQTQYGLDLVVNDANGAEVAWTGWDGTNYRVRVATTDPSAVFGAPTTASPAGENDVEGSLAGAPSGRAVVAWVKVLTDAPSGGIGASESPFTTPEMVTPGPEAMDPVAAYDPRSGGFALAWSDRPDGEAKPIQTFLQWSTQ